MHAVHGALWYRHAVLRLRELGGVQLVEPTGDSGKLGGDNVLGFGIVDFYRMFDIPQFDFVYLDLEGELIRAYKI